MDDNAIGKTVRRRRSWYRRRLRIQRTLIAVVASMFIAGTCWQSAAHHFSLPSWHASQLLPESFWTRGNVRKDLALMAARSAQPAGFLARIPGVYPYSVVPGGVKDPDELRYAAARDYVVRRHYARFDYSHARLVRATQAREVYLSYRIRDTVYWTRRKIRLHLGELLLTDGKITARARCGNQISDTAKPEVSNEEPEEDVLDRPVAQVEGPSFPTRPLLAASDLPGGEPIPPKLFASTFFFPYVPVGAPIAPRVCPVDQGTVSEHCRPKRHHKPPVVPEPSTMVLTASGLAFILWRYRKTVRPVA